MGLIQLVIALAILSVIAGLFGFTKIASGSAQIAKIIFYLILGLLVLACVVWFFHGDITLSL